MRRHPDASDIENATFVERQRHFSRGIGQTRDGHDGQRVPDGGRRGEVRRVDPVSGGSHRGDQGGQGEGRRHHHHLQGGVGI